MSAGDPGLTVACWADLLKAQEERLANATSPEMRDYHQHIMRIIKLNLEQAIQERLSE